MDGIGLGVGWLAALGLLVVAGWSQGGSPPDKGKPDAPKATPGQAWAEKVMACYEGALKDTVAAAQGVAPADALPKLRAMKEKAIAALVPLGREREAMDAPTKAQAQSAFLMKLLGAGGSEDFKKYQQLATGPYSAWKAKTAEEKEAAAIVASVNIITQYAQFELLKKQAPKEAERLGIK